MNLLTSSLLSVAVALSSNCIASEHASLEPLELGDQLYDCELMLWPKDSPDAPQPKILQIPLYEMPVAVIRYRGQRHELNVDEGLWRSLSTDDFAPGRHRIDLSGPDIDAIVTFTFDRTCKDSVAGDCMDAIYEGVIEIMPRGSDSERSEVEGAIGC